MNEYKKFTESLLEWFGLYGRTLPWRETNDPYKIWISEIMLQQTQVKRVAESFYPNFLKRFPDVYCLAQSTWEDVFPVWKGLGYYGRGRNMLRTAQTIVDRFEGNFPRDAHILQSLPGIGSYTACALLSFVWDEKVSAIDTNVHKIIQTLWSTEKVPSVAEQLIFYAPGGRMWNGAMMDLASALRAGETIEGALGGFFPEEKKQLFLPTKRDQKPKKKKRKHVIEVGIACIHKNGKYLIQSRPEGKSFTGHWEFPGGKREKGEDLRACVKREVQEELGIEISVRPHFFEEAHEFDKVQLVLRFHRCQIQKGVPHPLEKQKIDWVSPTEFGKIQFLETNANALQKLRGMRM